MCAAAMARRALLLAALLADQRRLATTGQSCSAPTSPDMAGPFFQFGVPPSLSAETCVSLQQSPAVMSAAAVLQLALGVLRA